VHFSLKPSLAEEKFEEIEADEEEEEEEETYLKLKIDQHHNK